MPLRHRPQVCWMQAVATLHAQLATLQYDHHRWTLDGRDPAHLRRAAQQALAHIRRHRLVSRTDQRAAVTLRRIRALSTGIAPDRLVIRLDPRERQVVAALWRLARLWVERWVACGDHGLLETAPATAHARGIRQLCRHCGHLAISCLQQGVVQMRLGHQYAARTRADHPAHNWDPLTQPIPGMPASPRGLDAWSLPEDIAAWSFRQRVAACSHDCVRQACHLVAWGLDEDGRSGWAELPSAERQFWGAGIFLFARCQAELAAAIGMPPARPPLPDWVDGLGLPALFTPPELPVWRSAGVASPGVCSP